MRDDARRTTFDTDVLGPLGVQLLLDGQEPNETRASPDREEVARRHYWIAAMTQREGLPVDWEYTALRMAQALLGLPEASLPEGDEA